MSIKKVSFIQVKAAEGIVLASKQLKEIPNQEIIKIANAKSKPDLSLPEDEIQYVLED